MRSPDCWSDQLRNSIKARTSRQEGQRSPPTLVHLANLSRTAMGPGCYEHEDSARNKQAQITTASGCRSAGADLVIEEGTASPGNDPGLADLVRRLALLKLLTERT
jgi:hypothetical protein